MILQKRLPRKFKKKCKKDLILSATYLNRKPIQNMLECANRRVLTTFLTSGLDRNDLTLKTSQ